MTQVVLYLLIGVFGFLLGALVVLLWSERERRRETQAERTTPTTAKNAQATGEASDTPWPHTPPFIDETYIPVARLWRDRATSQLLVEVDGTLHATPETLTDEQRQRLSTAAEGWTLWLGLHPPAPPLPSAPTPTTLNEPAEVLLAAQNEWTRSGSIVDQIDEILQDMLSESDYRDMVIHLKEEPTHGVVVWVNNQRFESVEDVPDEGIRALIQAAVRRWEMH